MSSVSNLMLTQTLVEKTFEWEPKNSDRLLVRKGKDLLVFSVCAIAIPTFAVLSASLQATAFIIKTPFVAVCLIARFCAPISEEFYVVTWFLHAKKVALLATSLFISLFSLYDVELTKTLYVALELSNAERHKKLVDTFISKNNKQASDQNNNPLQNDNPGVPVGEPDEEEVELGQPGEKVDDLQPVPEAPKMDSPRIDLNPPQENGAKSHVIQDEYDEELYFAVDLFDDDESDVAHPSNPKEVVKQPKPNSFDNEEKEVEVEERKEADQREVDQSASSKSAETPQVAGLTFGVRLKQVQRTKKPLQSQANPSEELETVFAKFHRNNNAK